MKRKTRLIRPRAAKTAAEIARIGALEARIADLEGRIARLEQAPLQQGWPQKWPEPQVPYFDDEPRCAVCHNRYRDMTHYVCGHPQCPSRITFTCGTQTERIVPVTTTDQPAYTVVCGGHKDHP